MDCISTSDKIEKITAKIRICPLAVTRLVRDTGVQVWACEFDSPVLPKENAKIQTWSSDNVPSEGDLKKKK